MLTGFKPINKMIQNNPYTQAKILILATGKANRLD